MPAVSLQIRELEKRLGVRLVERMGKRAYATAAGEELIAHARKLAQDAELAMAAMREHGGVNPDDLAKGEAWIAARE